MPRPIRTTINYDPQGKVSAIDHQVMRSGTADFGDGPKPAEEERRDQMASNLISAATVTAVKKLIDAFEVDISKERQRVATHAQAVADQAAADAAAAKVLADEVKP